MKKKDWNENRMAKIQIGDVYYWSYFLSDKLSTGWELLRLGKGCQKNGVWD